MAIKYGFIGSGFAAMHLEALQQIPDTQLTAVCSRNEAAAQTLIGDTGARYYTFENYLEMLQKEQLDAVYICVPPHLHGDLERACAEHVKGLLIEKPIALNLELATSLQTTFEQAGTIVSVGYMNRYRQNLIDARNYFSTNAPILINGAWSDELPPPYWWRRREMSGGQLTGQATHILDAIRYVAGEIEEVNAYATSGFIDNVEDFNVDDAMVMNIRLKNGAIGTVQTSCFTHDHGGGALGIYLDMASREHTYRFRNHQMDLQIQGPDHAVTAQDSAEHALLLENQAFINALQTGNTEGILSPYRDAIETLKISLAADISIAEKRSVSIAGL